MSINWGQICMVLLVLGWAGSPSAAGYSIPFGGSNGVVFASGMVMFISYIYFTRTLFRLPFALEMARRRYRHAKDAYKLARREALIDSYYRGFLDRRRWETGSLAIVDRLFLLLVTILACSSIIGQFLINLFGAMGTMLIVIIYIYSGNFTFLVGGIITSSDNPFRNIPSLRRPDQDLF